MPIRTAVVCRCTWLVCGMLLCLVGYGQSSASRSGPVDEALLDQLIRQLDDPAFRKREEACTALIALGPRILPRLEHAEGVASFEARANLDEIIRTLRELLRGVIVYRLVPESEAAQAGIRPGDVIVRVAGLPVLDFDFYNQIVEEDSRNPQPYVIRSGDRLREVELTPRRLGAELGDYEERYGPPLVEAIRAFHAGLLPPSYTSFAEAEKAGLAWSDRGALLVMYALAAYGSGEAEASHRLLESWAGSTSHPAPWEWLEATLPSFTPASPHLRLFVAERRFRARPDRAGICLDHGLKLCEMNQFPAGVATILRTLPMARRTRDEFSESLGWSTVLTALDMLNLGPEALVSVQQLARTESRPSLWSRAAAVAERFGGLRQAADIMASIAERRRQSNTFDAESYAEALRLRLLAGQDREVLSGLQALQAGHHAELLARLNPDRLAWPEARTVMLELARRAWEDSSGHIRSLDHAFEVLSRQKQPDAGELEELFGLCKQLRRGAGHVAAATVQDLEQAIVLAMVREQWDEAARLLDSAERSGVKPAQPTEEAVRFHRAADSWIGAVSADWYRTRFAWRLSEHEWVLLTRDGQLGLADAAGKGVRPLPAPAARWCAPARWDSCMLLTPRQRLLTASGQSLYELNRDLNRWERLAVLPPAYLPELPRRAERLDALVTALRHAGGEAEVVWPLTLEPDADHFALMLADGTWLAGSLLGEEVRKPRDAARKALGAPVDIYCVLPQGESFETAFLLSSEGVLLWRPGDGHVQRLSIPGLSSPKPVALTPEGTALEDGELRFGLFPGDGGTTYILNTRTRQIRLEGCVNEAIPLTYWRQMPAADRRRMLGEALEQAELDAPWVDTRPAG